MATIKAISDADLDSETGDFERLTFTPFARVLVQPRVLAGHRPDKPIESSWPPTLQHLIGRQELMQGQHACTCLLLRFPHLPRGFQAAADLYPPSSASPPALSFWTTLLQSPKDFVAVARI